MKFVLVIKHRSCFWLDVACRKWSKFHFEPSVFPVILDEIESETTHIDPEHVHPFNLCAFHTHINVIIFIAVCNDAVTVVAAATLENKCTYIALELCYCFLELSTAQRIVIEMNERKRGRKKKIYCTHSSGLWSLRWRIRLAVFIALSSRICLLLFYFP